MKRISSIIVALVAAIALAVPASSQVRFGVKLGLNVDKLSFKHLDKTLDNENGCGFTGGVMTEIGIPFLGLAVDASFMYTHMTGKSYVTTVDETGMQKDVMLQQSKNFLEIPVNLKCKFSLPVVNNLLSPYVLTGPTFAFKMGNDNWFWNTKDVQYSWNFGFGVEVVKHLQIQAQYSLGINNILKTIDVADNPVHDIKLKNNYWTITAAYLF